MRLIDADALKDWAEIVPLTEDGGIDFNDFTEKLDTMPTIDAVAVIRCKDCKWFEADAMTGPLGFCCHGEEVFERGWCYRAERRKDG